MIKGLLPLGLPCLFAFLSVNPAARTEDVTLNWLDQPPAKSAAVGVSFGVPWPRGTVKKDQTFVLSTSEGKSLPAQSWTLAYWPDGSIKWTGFATVANPAGGAVKVAPVSGPASSDAAGGIKIKKTDTTTEIDTGRLKCRISNWGVNLIDALVIDGREVATQGRLECVLQDRADGDEEVSPVRQKFTSEVRTVTLEQGGPVRAVVKVEGVHRALQGGRELLPFIVRFYFFAGQDSVRVVHTFIYDGDQDKDFIHALGLTFTVPMHEQVHNRHVRFSGENGGLWAEPLQPLTGARVLAPAVEGGPDPYREQLAGHHLPNREAFNAQGQNMMTDLAVWSDYKLTQATADGFTIKKRTNPLSPWIDAGAGHRASGLVFVGDAGGGLGVSMKNFWQTFPSSLEVRHAAGMAAELTVWLWSPDVPAMDLRHYDIKAHGLGFAYEDVQPGFSTPYGVARTTELTLYPASGVPEREETVRQAQAGAQPALLVCSPQYLHSLRAFGLWSLPDRSQPVKAKIEDGLDGAIAQYQREIDQHHWYGFWDFGDVMHTYDPARHEWRYDIGGFAWSNSELVPDMWLWYSFLRTGRADIFRMAEAMARHNGESDCYHIGPFAGLGSRHNVQHWGCGAKEARISQAALRRFYYYLTTDERTGDLMHETIDSDFKLLQIDPMREAMPVDKYPTASPCRIRVGPDWLGYVANWMTEWERTGETKYRDKIIAGMDSIAAMKYGLFSGPGVLGYDPNTGRLYDNIAGRPTQSSHLVMIMGGAEVGFELLDLIDHPPFRKAWVDYCEYYNMPPNDPARNDSNRLLGGTGGFPNWHARMTAYAARAKNDPVLAARAWKELGTLRSFKPTKVEGAATLNPLEEIPGMSTNGVSQACLNAIEVLELVGDKVPATVNEQPETYNGSAPLRPANAPANRPPSPTQ